MIERFEITRMILKRQCLVLDSGTVGEVCFVS